MIIVDFEPTVTGAIAYQYPDNYTYHYVEYTFQKTGTQQFTLTAFYGANFQQHPEYVTWDAARYLGALYRVSGSPVKYIVYKGTTYYWNESLNLKGSNWYDGTNTLISVLTQDFQQGATTFVFTLKDDIGNSATLTTVFAVKYN